MTDSDFKTKAKRAESDYAFVKPKEPSPEALAMVEALGYAPHLHLARTIDAAIAAGAEAALRRQAEAALRVGQSGTYRPSLPPGWRLCAQCGKAGQAARFIGKRGKPVQCCLDCQPFRTNYK